MASVFVKDIQGDALVSNKKNIKGKSRGILHSRSSGDPEKNEESSNYNGKKPLICYQCGKCLAIEARAIDVMINVVGIKQEVFAVVSSDDMVPAIQKIKQEDLEQVVSETTYANKNLYKESIDEDVLKVELHGQSLKISRSTNDSEQILEAYGENRDQIEEEDDIEVLKKNI